MDKAARAALLTAKRKDNASENIADYVADLLRQGRASEVTDDLMAQADPQRLHHHYTSGNTGMDLPMDQASRMERAKGMGFDTKAYHGTNTSKEFSSFGKSVNSKRRETYLAPEEHKDFANSFSSSDQGRVFPLLANVSGFHNGRTEEGREALKDLAYEKNFQPELYANHLKGDPNTLRPVSWGDQNSIDKLNEAGYPGAVIEERPWMDSYAVFDPTKVRSQFARFDPRLEHLAHLSASTGGAMEFARHVEAVHRAGGQMAPSKYLPNVPRQVHADGGRINANGGGVMNLRSKAAQVIRNQPQEKGNVDQMLAMMAAKGVKPSELVNAGRPFGHSVSKEELAKHFEDAVPKVQVHRSENTSGGLSDAEKQRMRHLEAIGPHNLNANELSEWAQLATREDNQNQAKYGQYTLPGGENYREHLLHLPKGNGDTFRSSHWETPNVLAHLRMKDRDNGKTLHVEEVQSDWGQNGREQGFYDPEKPFEVVRKGTKVVVSRHPDWSSMWDAYRLHPESDQLNYGDVRSEKVPQGPYVGNTQHWTDLAVKHALTEAAKGGHNRVVFSPGEANADLYGQRTPIKWANFRKFDKSEGIDALGALSTMRPDWATPDFKVIENEKELSKALGSEHAKKILSAPLTPHVSGHNVQSLQDPDMYLGGHGMVDYYKNYVHPAALKLLRQHDPSIQPESYDLPNGYKGFALPMTDKARQSILDNGFQAFKDGGTVDDNEDDGITAYHGSPHSFDSFDISKLGTGEGHQAYGHGLYFGGNEDVARHYREMLANGYSIDGKQYNATTTKTGAVTPGHHAADALDRFKGDKQSAIDWLTGGGPTDKEAAKLLKKAKTIEPWTGHMYKVKLNVQPHELLDWDKPLSEQHPRVQEVLRSFGAKPEDTGEQAYMKAGTRRFAVMGQNGKWGPGGSTHEESLAQVGGDPSKVRSIFDGSPQARSAGLLEQGIKGIKYRDAGSRDLSDGDPTHNYVMFHHDPVQVTDKYEYGGMVGKAGGGAMGDGITAYHGSPYSFDQFDISKLGTGEGNQSYGHGLYFAGNEKVAKYYRDALTDPEQTHLHFDQRPVDTPWNEEIRARWPEHFAGKSQRDQDAMEEALGNLSQVNNLKDVPNALSNMSAAAKYMYQRHIKPKLTKPDLGKGHMYKVHLQVKPSELLDWDKPLSEQHPEVQKALNENLRKSNNLKKFMIENPTGGELHEALSDKGSYRDQISASEQLLAAGLKGIKYRDADSRDLSDGDATHNYVMFHHDPIKVMSKYEYGGTVDRALALTRRFTKNGKAATASLKKKPL